MKSVERCGIDERLEIYFFAPVGRLTHKEPVVEAHFCIDAVLGGDPVQGRLDLPPVGGRATTCRRVVAAT